MREAIKRQDRFFSVLEKNVELHTSTCHRVAIVFKSCQSSSRQKFRMLVYAAGRRLSGIKTYAAAAASSKFALR